MYSKKRVSMFHFRKHFRIATSRSVGGVSRLNRQLSRERARNSFVLGLRLRNASRIRLQVSLFQSDHARQRNPII